MILSHKYRVEPTPSQEAALTAKRSEFGTLDNAAFEERINAYRTTATAQAEVVWGKSWDRRGLEREGYLRQHPADVRTLPSKRPRACASASAPLPDASEDRSVAPSARLPSPRIRNTSPTSAAMTCTRPPGRSSIGRIAVEDLNLKGLTRDMHATHVNDASWGNSSRYSTTKLRTLVVGSSRSIHAAQVNNFRNAAAKTLADRRHRW